MTYTESLVKRLLGEAGITVNGDKPYDIQVHTTDFYRKVLFGGSLALGELYVDGAWDVADHVALIERLLTAGLEKRVPGLATFILSVRTFFQNHQTMQLARRVGVQHYDHGLELYRPMLGSTLAYSCGYAPGMEPFDLDAAQNAKLDLVCRKLELTGTMRLLDIGCGWGSMLDQAVSTYGVEATGITISENQAAHCTQRLAGKNARVLVQDYRDLSGTYDAIVSIGMWEHVGPKNYREAFQTIRRHLAPGGLFVLHTICGLEPAHQTDPWIERYIFPGGVNPAPSQVLKAAEGVFAVRDMHNIGMYYAPTLLAWHENVQTHWDEIAHSNPAMYTERFKRLWKHYLLLSAAAFRTDQLHVEQFVFSHIGEHADYQRKS